MENKGFFRRVRFILPISLLILFISSPIGAQTDYPINVVPASYIEANTVLSLTGDDASEAVDLPFPFTFYGVTYTTKAYVSTNGYLNFLEQANHTASTNYCTLPRLKSPDGSIYAFWDDLEVDGNASVRTELRGTEPKREFVIEWRNVTRAPSEITGPRIDFEIVLYETGAILLQYRNIDLDDIWERGGDATIGLESPPMPDGSNVGLQFSCNTATFDKQEYAILFGNLAKDVPVAVDIKPRVCPNPLNLVSKGVLRVAILGTADFDVRTIDPASLTLQGVAPLRWRLEDVASPYEPFVGKTDIYQCNTSGPDKHLDMVLKFDTEKIAAAIGDANASAGQALLLKLEGNLQDGETKIKGEDSVVIIRGHHKRDIARGHHKKEKERGRDRDDDKHKDRH